MSEGSDEVEIKAAIEGKSLSIKSKSRAVSAIDRLLGGMINIPAEWFQGQADLVKARMKSRAQAVGSEQILEILEDRERLRLLRSAQNKQATVKAAIEYLEPPAKDDLDGEIDQAWLDTFERYASIASSEDARKLWGLILSRKIKDPDEVSAPTLNLLASINAETAKEFEKIREIALDETIPVDQGGDRWDIPTISRLQAAGLIIGVGGTLSQTYHPTKEGAVNVVLGNYILRMNLKDNRPLRFSVVIFTPAGKEIHNILPTPDGECAATNLVELCKNQISEAYLGRVISRTGDETTFSDERCIFSSNSS